MNDSIPIFLFHWKRFLFPSSFFQIAVKTFSYNYIYTHMLQFRSYQTFRIQTR
ncbi:hypothetical protein K450DRAFT_261763 [Umbelopsis ramanniana AG]|uniref:Uncharacterized protein n=1 Tax=Umbelopsis ramanniana AG TaxID=1314678 RepID=A0AAD5HAE8_UMBRA|nr:uncharacterized protein K450DRAFT_261763 [Umbelopsis ramanniana AG]KAI8575446.1 hypothetical protein K450DRAFT_261763 [Umbelopsis ramanniana AG]